MPHAYDTVVTGGRLVSSERVTPATIAIQDGRIAGMLSPADRPAAEHQIDATGLHVLPGIIDTHVRSPDPARTRRGGLTWSSDSKENGPSSWRRAAAWATRAPWGLR